MKNAFSVTSNLQTNFRLKLDFQKVDQQTVVKWSIPSTKHSKQLQSLELPFNILVENRIQIWHKGSYGNVLNPIF